MTTTPVLAPVGGRAVPLQDVPDPVFSQGMVGYGAAIDPPRGVIDAIARKRGCLLTRSGGGLDRDKAARILLSDYRNGTLGRTSLETPGAWSKKRS